MTDLDARYGRTAKRSLRIRMIAIIGAVSVITVTILWSLWGGLGQDSSAIETHNIGHRAQSAHSTIVQFSVTAEPGTPLRCALQALDETYGTVGWLEVDLPVTDEWTNEYSYEFLTSAQSVSAQVYRCWPADA